MDVQAIIFHLKAYRMVFVAFLFLLCGAAVALPTTSYAVLSEADEMCVSGRDYSCPCGATCSKGGLPGGLNCPCKDMTNSFATFGVCVDLKKCLAKSTSDGMFDVGQAALGLSIDGVMKALQGGQPGGNFGQTPFTQSFGGDGCVQYFKTSDISQLSNPCAQYVPAVSDKIDAGAGYDGCDLVNSILGKCGGGTVATGTNTSGNTISTITTKTPRVIFQPNLGGFSGPLGGLRGDILQYARGATVVAGARDDKNNVEVAGFYGSQTFGNQESQSLVGRWCQSRPWAGNFLSRIAAPSFFDDLCKARGYQVGVATSTPQVTLIQKSATKKATSTSAATSTPAVPPKADIWASPPSVPLGGRTSIFWDSQGVMSCTETSIDGNFNQKSLSGGSATVPIIGATTFTITCLVSDGSTVTSSVTVNLKI